MLINVSKKYLLITLLLMIASGAFGYWLHNNKSETGLAAPVVRITAEDRKQSYAGEDVDFKLYWQVWKLLQENYYKQPVEDINLFYGSLRGLVSGLNDPYSNFLDPEVTKEFTEELSGNFEGIGAEIGIKQGQLSIIAPLPDTPAERAGLASGDHILAIDDLDTSFMSLDRAVQLIRGPRGTSVVLTIFSPGKSDDFREIEVTRDIIHFKSVRWETLSENIALITISHFNEDTNELFRQAVVDVLSQDTQGIIIDLRNNPGGFLDTAVKIAGYWTGDKTVVLERLAGGQKNTYQAAAKGLLADYRTVVLVNQGSASASEIVAGALQDYGLATILGETTFGKGTVQSLEPLPDGSAVKFTIAEWLTPNEHLIDEIGIEPDIFIEMLDEDFADDNDPQLDKAIEYLQNIKN